MLNETIGLEDAVTLERMEYRGWKDCIRIANGRAQLIVLTEVGPRILFFGLAGGPNEFYEAPQDEGKTGGQDFRSYGGHRLWASPEVERTYYPDNVPVSIRQQGDTVTVTAPPESTPPGTGLQKEIAIKLHPVEARVTVIHRIMNCGDEPTELAPWALSVMAGGGRAILPLPPRAPVSKDRLLPGGVLGLWSYTDLADPRWTIGTKYIQLAQDNSPLHRFKEQMIGSYNPSGWGAYFRQGHLFIKKAEVKQGARYPDFGCNFELYTEPSFLELETLGPLQNLNPGQVAEHTEEWWLFPEVADGSGDAWVDSVILPIVESAR